MIKSVQEIQHKFEGKMKEFNQKQQQYMETIKQLENKLKEEQNAKKIQ